MTVKLPDLPIRDALPALVDALATQQRAILVAPPGAGKTTVIPVALLDQPWRADGRIVMLEPRRLAARAAARRMAETTGTEVGDLVGYQTRDERRISARTRIEVLTEGILTRRLQRDPELPGVTAVLFDEVHERNVPTDLGMALLLDAAETIRPDLRIVAMSATPDIESLVAFLDAPVVESAGRSFDVDIRWSGSAATTRSRQKGRAGSRARRAGAGGRNDLVQSTTAATIGALADDDGDVLIFLPGIGEIRRVESALEAAVGPNVDVFALAGALDRRLQDQALAPSAAGRRRVVLATDIAETSLTVAGIRIVIDAGLSREPRFDPRTGMTRLTTVTASRASADQRAGRAGRTAPGVAYRLWSKVEHSSRARYRTPEIESVELAGVALELAAWGDRPRFIDDPPAGALDQAGQLLADLGAVGDDGAITGLGRTMLDLPVHPRLARMIAGAQNYTACAVAALLDDRDIFGGRPEDRPADLALRLAVVAGQHGFAGADRNGVARIVDRTRDLVRRAGLHGTLDDIDPDQTGALLLLAYPDRLAGQRRPGQYQLRNGTGAWLPDDDSLAHEPFVVAADLDGKRDRARIRLGAALEEADIINRHGDEIEARNTIRWDRDRGDLVETIERRLGAIRLATSSGPPPPGEETTAALLTRVRDTDLGALSWSDAATALRARVTFLHQTIGEPWPNWSTAGLRSTLDEWLAPFLHGARRIGDVEALDMVTVLRAQLPWPQGAELDELAPPTLQLPAGREVPLDYDGDEPAAAVRVQDLFGLDEHPTAAGRMIRLSLLSPADRPLQVTTDLPGFWRGTWTDVRKDMAGRYPKHQWPEHPERAAPRRLKGDR
ncbi:MAG: ATP-dependent helicase HrpB [Actinomycetota bacterium]